MALFRHAEFAFVGLDGANLDDGLPYTTLSYANGNAFYEHNIPYNVTSITRYEYT